MAAPGRPVSHLHPRRWGAEFVRSNEVRFRIWAPGQSRMLIEIDGSHGEMERDSEGWFEIVADGVGEGASYRFILEDGLAVPDPAARAQAGDVHGPSLVIDPASYGWRHHEWTGRPWEEAVVYELHVGTFTGEGTFDAARNRLEYLADIGVTVVELMPVAQFPGRRGWGYDGVLPYAPHNAYGSPAAMKAFIDAAHGLGLMVLLDVVYNHFGPDGNYLHAYAPDFFHAERQTPWGPAIAYNRLPVRQFFFDNALYWLEEFQLDGLRFDAIDNIRDEASDPEFMVEIAQIIRAQLPGRHIHLTTEDNRNITHLHGRGADGTLLHTAGWNDDFHNAAHVIATGETDGYYEDFAEAPIASLARALAEGFAYQGEPSAHTGAPRGEASRHLPPTAFIDFLQNHDQTGNRARGERLSVLADRRQLEVLQAILLLSPHVPLLFMGEEWGETNPFLFFTDFHGELAKAVRDGRRREFAQFAAFSGQGADIPDPNARATLESSRIDWRKPGRTPHAEWLARTRRLLGLRRRHVVPMLAGTGADSGTVLACPEGAIAVDWRLGGGRLCLRANLTAQPVRLPAAGGIVVEVDPPAAADATAGGDMPAMAVLVTAEPAEGLPVTPVGTFEEQVR